MKSKKENREVLLLGEGGNQHTLYGDFSMNGRVILAKVTCQLRHESSSQTFAEHNTILVDQGKWILGRQIEYNPLLKNVTRVLD